MITLKQVSKALKAAGHEAELLQGDGFLWFDSEEAGQWYTSNVAVCRLNQRPDVNWWVSEYERLKDFNKDR